MLFGRNKSSGVSWLIVGLGNMGEEYEGTRHNAGFEVLDLLARDLKVSVRRLKFKALTATAQIGGQGVLLMKPTTYMNLSGEAVVQAAAFYKVPPHRVLVISDEVALPPGKLRIRASGSAGGHNGLKNIIALLHSENFPRIRVGVGSKPHPDYDMVDWVLGRPQGEDRKALDEAEQRAADAIQVILTKGLDRAMEKYNQ